MRLGAVIAVGVVLALVSAHRDGVARASYVAWDVHVQARAEWLFERLARAQFKREVGRSWPRDAALFCTATSDAPTMLHCEVQVSYRRLRPRAICEAWDTRIQAVVNRRTGVISFVRRTHQRPGVRRPVWTANPLIKPEAPKGRLGSPIAAASLGGRRVAIRRDAAGRLWLTESPSPWPWRHDLSGHGQLWRTRPCRYPRYWVVAGVTDGLPPTHRSVRVTVPTRRLVIDRALTGAAWLAILPSTLTRSETFTLTDLDAMGAPLNRPDPWDLSESLGSSPDTSGVVVFPIPSQGN